MKNVLGILLALAMIGVGVAVIALWPEETISYLGASALITAGLVLIISPFLKQRSK